MKKLISIILFSLLCFGAAVLGGLFCAFNIPWVNVENFISGPKSKQSIVLDANGCKLFIFSRERTSFVTFRELPQILIDAFVAAEDHNFFTHHGISFKGIVRSIMVNFIRRKKAQGASTITQQLARLMCVGHKKTFLRKIKEIFTALQLECLLTKEQVFELYVNNIYFGHGIYGVQAATKRFWGKNVGDITIGQAAILAAVAKSALFYSPLNSLDGAKKRRNIILASMYGVGLITKKNLDSALACSVEIKECIGSNRIRPYLQEAIRYWCEKRFGADALYTDGLTIRTTIDCDVQEVAETIFRDHVGNLRNRVPGVDGGLLSIEPWNGKIRAMVGGLDFSASQFNRALQAVRQLGSVFKPIVYAAAVDSGISLETFFVDEPFSVDLELGKKWTPKNWDSRFHGEISLKDALAESSNVVTAKLFMQIGANKVLDIARKCGLSRRLLPYPASALGIAEASMQECLAAFNVFANRGMLVDPYFIESVSCKNKKMYVGKPKQKRALDGKTSEIMADALKYTVARYGKLKGAVGGGEYMGKSGSTNEAGTMWFVGSSQTLSTAIYVGRDDNKPLGKNFFAFPTVYPIWHDFYLKLA